jgi:hypothetical protein
LTTPTDGDGSAVTKIMAQIRDLARFCELVVFENVRLSDLGLSATTAKNDVGRFVITGKPEDHWIYTTPALRVDSDLALHARR